MARTAPRRDASRLEPFPLRPRTLDRRRSAPSVVASMGERSAWGPLGRAGRLRSTFFSCLLLPLLSALLFGAASLPAQVGGGTRAGNDLPVDVPPAAGQDRASRARVSTRADEDPWGTPLLSFLETRFEDARTAYERGLFKEAWQISDAILVLAPEVPFHDQVRRLRRRAQGRFIGRSVVVVTFEPTETPDFPAKTLVGDVVIENHSAERIEIGRAEKDPVLGILHFVDRAFSAYSLGESRNEGTRVIRMPEEILVEPGDVHRIPVTIDLPPHDGGTILQRWEVSGTLRPITVKVGRELLTRGVPWVKNQGRWLPDEVREVESDPRDHLRRALLTGDPLPLIVGALVWLEDAEEDGPTRNVEARAALLEELLAALGTHDGALDRCLIRILEQLTGEVRERTVRSWQIWALTRPRPSTLPDEEGSRTPRERP